jgi:hypothetical protein
MLQVVGSCKSLVHVCNGSIPAIHGRPLPPNCRTCARGLIPIDREATSGASRPPVGRALDIRLFGHLWTFGA